MSQGGVGTQELSSLSQGLSGLSMGTMSQDSFFDDGFNQSQTTYGDHMFSQEEVCFCCER